MIREESLRKSPLSGLLSARYLLLLMGLFAFYCGLIYNDFTAVTINLFGSCYDINETVEPGSGEKVHERSPDPECVYTFGKKK